MLQCRLGINISQVKTSATRCTLPYRGSAIPAECIGFRKFNLNFLSRKVGVADTNCGQICIRSFSLEGWYIFHDGDCSLSPPYCHSQTFATSRLLLLGAIVHGVCAGAGCSNTRQSMTQFIPSVPNTLWNANRDVKSEDISDIKPSVKANVAAIEEPSESKSDLASGSASVTLENRSGDPNARPSFRKEPRTARTGVHVSSFSPDHEGNLTHHESAKSALPSQSVPDAEQDQIERLKAALAKDAHRDTDPDRIVGGVNNDARVRVDSLLSRAKRLFDGGQLNDARQKAQQAQMVGELARLDFSPNEERPIDLVHQIEDHLATQRNPLDPAETDPVTGDVVEPVEADFSDQIVTPANEQTREKGDTVSSRSWLRERSIGTVFRRGLKNTSPETNTGTPNAETTDGQALLPIELSKDTDSTEAIVNANRGVTLTVNRKKFTTEPIQKQGTLLGVRSRSRKSDESDPSSIDSKASVADPFEENRTEAASEEIRDLLDWSAASPLKNDSQLTANEIATDGPSFEDVRPVSRPRSMDRGVGSLSPVRQRNAAGTASYSRSVIGAAAIIVCSMLALACYIRGAT